jgi:hypothetical protein
MVSIEIRAINPHPPFSDGSRHVLNKYCSTCHAGMDRNLWDADGNYKPSNQPACDQASPRAIVPTDDLNIIIIAIPHIMQRYDTCGDWYEAPAFWEQMKTPGDRAVRCLQIRVSAELPRKEQFLAAIHELVEAFLCECAGVSEAEVDKFDLAYGPPDEGEPGDESIAPYYRQHQFASGIERILAAEAGVDWLNYERHINELSNLIDKPPAR